MTRRTKKEKLEPRHPFLISWEKTEVKKPLVKRQLVSEPEATLDKNRKTKNAEYLAKDSNLTSIKRDIVKSLIFASLILGLEIVIYLAWNV